MICLGIGLGACDQKSLDPLTDPAPALSQKNPTHIRQVAEIRNGYVSGSLYEVPPYQVTFDLFRLKRWLPIAPNMPLFTEEGPLPKPEDDEEGARVLPADTFYSSGPLEVDGREAEIDPLQGMMIFPFGIVANGGDGFRARAEKGVWWYREGILYLEGHVEFSNREWNIRFESIVLDMKRHRGLGRDARMIIRNPSGILGLGRGSNLPAIVRGKELRLFEEIAVHRPDIVGRSEILETEGGQARLGSAVLFDLGEKFSSDVTNPFAGARVGRNSRHGEFIESRFRLFNGSFGIGDAAVRGRLLLLENWYERRGFGHGLEGRYNMKVGRATAQGRLRGLVVKDQDRDRKQGNLRETNRFYGNWMHRGTHPDGWRWNFELSRESDVGVRDEFDRKASRRGKPYQNRIFVSHRTPNRRLSVLLQSRSEEFVREVDYLPRLQWDWIDIAPGPLVLDGHLQLANARLNQAEAPHRDAPSIRTLRGDLLSRIGLPLTIASMRFEPYGIGSLTWYDRQQDRDDELVRGQAGSGIVIASRWTRGIYRLLPRVDARRLFTPSNSSRAWPLIDEIDDRHALETVELDWRHLVRGSIAGDRQDLWDLDVRITGYPNSHRDNDDKHWSLLDQSLDIRPHRNFELFARGDYDVAHNKYREAETGFVINPESRVEIGTGSSGREIFSSNSKKLEQGRGRREEWAFLIEHRYTESEPSRLTGQLDLLPRDKWRCSYAQEWKLDGTPQIALHRLKVDHDLHDWTLSLDLEFDQEDKSSSLSVDLSPHGWGQF